MYLKSTYYNGGYPLALYNEIKPYARRVIIIILIKGVRVHKSIPVNRTAAGRQVLAQIGIHIIL